MIRGWRLERNVSTSVVLGSSLDGLDVQERRKRAGIRGFESCSLFPPEARAGVRGIRSGTSNFAERCCELGLTSEGRARGRSSRQEKADPRCWRVESSGGRCTATFTATYGRVSTPDRTHRRDQQRGAQ